MATSSRGFYLIKKIIIIIIYTVKNNTRTTDTRTNSLRHELVMIFVYTWR